MNIINIKTQDKVDYSKIAVGEFFISGGDILFKYSTITGVNSAVRINDGVLCTIFANEKVVPVDVEMDVYSKGTLR